MNRAQTERAWPRRQEALVMRRAGMTFQQIGKRLDVTRERARQIVITAEFQERQRQAKNDDQPRADA